MQLAIRAILPLVALISTATVSAGLGLAQPSQDPQRSDQLHRLSSLSSSSYPPRLFAQSASPQCWLERAPDLPDFESDAGTRYCFPTSPPRDDCKKCSVLQCIPTDCRLAKLLRFQCEKGQCNRRDRRLRDELITRGCFKNLKEAVSDICIVFFVFCRQLRVHPGFDVQLSSFTFSHVRKYSTCTATADRSFEYNSRWPHAG